MGGERTADVRYVRPYGAVDRGASRANIEDEDADADLTDADMLDDVNESKNVYRMKVLSTIYVIYPCRSTAVR